MKLAPCAVALLLLIGGCTCGVPAVGQVTFPCHANADCDAGFCNLDSGVCVVPVGPCPNPGLCGDPNCIGTACSVGSSPNCCGTSNLLCVNLGNDPANCGQCGITCPSGVCNGGFCSCSAGGCPGGGDAGFAQQTCTNGTCHCTSQSQCPHGNDCNGGVCSTGG